MFHLVYGENTKSYGGNMTQESQHKQNPILPAGVGAWMVFAAFCTIAYLFSPLIGWVLAGLNIAELILVCSKHRIGRVFTFICSYVCAGIFLVIGLYGLTQLGILHGENAAYSVYTGLLSLMMSCVQLIVAIYFHKSDAVNAALYRS